MSREQLTVKRTRLHGEERRALILRSTKRVFARSTYTEASTGELAHESEVTEPMLYKHFGSKKGLFLAVLSESATHFRETLQERILFQAVTEASDPDIAHCVSGNNGTMYGFIRQLVERAQQNGSLDPTISPDAATWGYMSIILATQYGLMLNLSGDVAQVQEEMSRVWLRGLRAPGD